jgi:gluconolactonase
MRHALLAMLVLATPALAQEKDYPALGTIERLDPRLDAIIPPGAKVERLAEGFDWSEGPVWISEDGGYLLFSDVPQNVVYRWDEKGGAREAIRPSGYTGSTPRGGEPGSNGLIRDPKGRLVLMQHGDRRVARREGDRFVALVSDFEGKRFNSPNDGTFDSKGNLYFTDPPYGLEQGVDDPKKELPFQGVYRLTPEGKLTLLTKEMSRPNGIALSPDETTLYVANSDPERAAWMAFPLKDDGTLGPGKVFFDATKLVGPDHPGLPDGMKVDRKGNLFATGPGGVFIFAPDGTHLGTLNTGQATANVGWGGPDGSVLYITADMYIGRVQTKTQGKGF